MKLAKTLKFMGEEVSIVSPLPTETTRGGITANIRTDESEEVVIDPQTGRAYTQLTVFNAATHYDFPSIGSVDVIYKAYSERKTYQWNAEKLVYEKLNESSSLENVTIINGGNANGN